MHFTNGGILYENHGKSLKKIGLMYWYKSSVKLILKLSFKDKINSGMLEIFFVSKKSHFESIMADKNSKWWLKSIILVYFSTKKEENIK